MQFLILTMIIAVSLVDQLTTSRLLPRPLAFVPELFSCLVVIYVVTVGARQRFRNVRAQYWLVFGAIATIMVCGVLANAVAPGPVVAGIRYYLRPIPFFLLPAVFDFSDLQIKQQLRLLLFVGLAQLPVALYQRMIVMRAHHFSGDSVVGTLVDSSLLSIFLICAVCVLTGMFLRRAISKPMFFFLFFYLLAATTINETKGTLILLPIGLVAAVLIGAPPAKRIRLAVMSVVLFAVFVVGFAVVYDYVQNTHNPYYTSLESFFLDEKKLDRYVDTHSGLGAERQAGRVDAVEVPLRELAHDPASLAFGFGIGNVSHSNLGPQFIGQHYQVYKAFLVSSFSIFLLELGVVGTALVFVLYWFIFQDSLFVARNDPGFMNWLAVGWAGVAVMMVVATPYKVMHAFQAPSYLFWYVSGLIAARRMRLELMPLPQAAGRNTTAVVRVAPPVRPVRPVRAPTF